MLGQKGRGQDAIYLRENVTWNELYRIEPIWISFLLNSVYGVLPSPFDLLNWDFIEHKIASYVSFNRTLGHIMSG